jgi:uncharacterized protein with von Willebrand factor type A (vWA) domain
VIAMLELITAFADDLRKAGLPVSLTESLDAVQALRHTPLADQQAVRCALGATLVKDQAHRAAFDLLFDIYFASRAVAEAGTEVGPASAPFGQVSPRSSRLGTLRDLSCEDLCEVLVKALLKDDCPAIDAIAVEAVTRYSTIQPARPMTDRYYVYRTLRGLDFDALPARLATVARPPTAAGPDPVDQRLAAAEHARRLGYLRGRVEAGVLRRLVAAQGPAAIASTLRKPLPGDVEFLRASPADLEAMQAALEPMTRRLTVRLMRRDRRRGALDSSATMRHSLSYGGVLAEPVFRERRPIKPEIIVLADISGSVAAFVRFTFLLARAISARFSRVRSFVFVDTIEEVTGLLAPDRSIQEMLDRIDRGARTVTVDGHSDYGNVLETFWTRCGREVNHRTTVLIVGDARNNHHLSQAWVVREMSRRARHLFWLNPEPRAHWDTGDSVMAEYAPHCDAVAECRNLRQLEHFVKDQLL